MREISLFAVIGKEKGNDNDPLVGSKVVFQILLCYESFLLDDSLDMV